MLQLANLSSSSLPATQKKQVELSHLVRQCLAELQPIAQQRKLDLHLELAEVQLPGVEDHLKMVLGNLLSNAMNYSHAGGRIEVCCGAHGDGGASFSVSDEGIGIAAEKLPHIFDEYYRTNEAVKHNHESSGLGLAIVKHVALQHSIGVRVESGPGAGTTFELTFPPAEAEQA